MSTAILLPNSSLQNMIPASPDPTPLRMLAFSVAEAALSSDPNSPMFISEHKEAFSAGWKEWNGGVKTVAQRRGKVWDVVEKAKERKERSNFIENAAPSPPIASPSAYNFTLPATSHLAANIARQQSTTVCKPTTPFTKRQSVHYETQSAEPSPTRSTFSGLDQKRPPPEFVPRLSAVQFVQEAQKVSVDVAAVRERRRSSIEPLSTAALAQHTAETATVPPARPVRRSRLPSLQQIQAKVSGTGRLRRSGSDGALPAIRPTSPRTQSIDSVDSVEILQTPTDEIPNPLLNRRLALQRIMQKRPATPPSPVGNEPRLSSFLRERTNGRLASVSKGDESRTTPDKLSKPVLKVTPPSLENRPAVPPLHLGRATQVSPTKGTFAFQSGFSTPTESRFANPFSHLSTPPPRTGASSPVSPTASIRSLRSGSSGMAGSPTLPPIITCTPAPGADHESDSGSEASEEILVWHPETEELERAEREMMGMAMRDKLSRRRSSGLV
ncbi:uncharacterized protein MKK02DRAFT_16558 [Dioszegia hungarica]|uniref:Uncharacterized protein n=1 Tax=Dioszegia hungarica TaxID=4972 RepID=A0AA38LRV7_9TREE|nr:uncharacterized protein MKK02DRAFT_16558 [Dioszegia hungarica]KAI9634917.1 hypothetical protein MKK02DRAFT_16558 [Dioszegia hungarica]